MKLISGLVVLTMALLISAVAAYFSVIGLAALFAAAFWPVIVMGSALETGKIVAATWLHANWHNPKVNFVHKAYLSIAVGVLMAITALGIYGYLAKGHLEQEAPLAGMELQIARIDQQIKQTREERQRLEVRLTQLDRSIDTIMGTAKTTRDTQAALKARDQQRKERTDIAREMATKDAEINRLTDALAPLRLKVSDVTAKLGPVKYVASLFGWQDPSTAVQMIIAMIMFAFDPLALTLVLSAGITLGDWAAARRARHEQNRVETAPAPAPEPVQVDAELSAMKAMVRDTEEWFASEVAKAVKERLEQANMVSSTHLKIDYPMGGFDLRTPLVVSPPYPLTDIKVAQPVSAPAIDLREPTQPVVISVDNVGSAVDLPQVEAVRPLISDKEHILALLEKHPEFVEEMINIVKESTDAANAATVAETIMPTSADNLTMPRVWIDQKPSSKSK